MSMQAAFPRHCSTALTIAGAARGGRFRVDLTATNMPLLHQQHIPCNRTAQAGKAVAHLRVSTSFWACSRCCFAVCQRSSACRRCSSASCRRSSACSALASAAVMAALISASVVLRFCSWSWNSAMSPLRSSGTSDMQGSETHTACQRYACNRASYQLPKLQDLLWLDPVSYCRTSHEPQQARSCYQQAHKDRARHQLTLCAVTLPVRAPLPGSLPTGVCCWLTALLPTQSYAALLT